jgi:hypothetical protein
MASIRLHDSVATGNIGVNFANFATELVQLQIMQIVIARLVGASADSALWQELRRRWLQPREPGSAVVDRLRIRSSETLGRNP